MIDPKIKRSLGMKAGLLAAVVAVLVAATVAYAPVITRLIRDIPGFAVYLQSFGMWGIGVFILIQALQVVISPIPGEFTQLAGGFVYGTFWGSIYTSVGIMGGAIVAFAISRLVGFPVLKLLAPAKILEKFGFLINNPKAELVILILFLIPGVPKDILTYIGGLTPIKPVRFIVTASVARLPGVLLSSYIGAHMESREYTQVIVASVISVTLFVVGVLFQDRLVRWFKRHHSRQNVT